MYHHTVVEAKIERAAASGKLPFKLSYHSRAEVDHAIKVINTTRELDDKGEVRVVRPLEADEVSWIRNERFLCRVDFRYFAARYCYIKNAFDQIVQFNPWVSQNIFLDVVADMELQELAIMLQCLKARQLGLSRVTSLLVLHRLICFPHINAVIASSTPEKTRLLADMLDFVFDRLPFWLVPQVTARREGELLEFKHVDTGLTLQHGSQLTGIARGTTPTIAHLSELAEFEDPASIVDSSLLRAMHDSVKTMLILEGTAEGQNNWWHDKWLSSKKGWPEHRSRLRPLFLPWFCGTDLYPTATWLRAHPIPVPYLPQPWVQDHVSRARDYVAHNDLLKKYLPNGHAWEMPVEQQWYYEVERGQAVHERRLNKFLQEMPASDDEAFQSTNISVFDTEVIAHYRDHTRHPVGVYGLLASPDVLAPRFQPHRSIIDANAAPIEVKANWGTGFAVPYTLMPLRYSDVNTDLGLDKIYLWETPEAGETYGLGVDTSDGVDKDRTTIEILRKGSPYRRAGQVGEFATGKLNALDATPFCMALGTYFSVNDHEGIVRQPRVAIECRGNGDQTQLRMRLQGWYNFHPWLQRNIDSRKMQLNQYNKIGVFTNSWFRTAMMEYLVSMLRDEEIEVRSSWFVQEMATLEADDFRQSLRAAHGGHDDRIMALGFVLISLYQFEKDRTVRFTGTAESQSLPGRYATYTRNLQETG